MMKSGKSVDSSGRRLFRGILRSLVVLVPIMLISGCAVAPRHPKKAYEAGKWRIAIKQSSEWLAEHPHDTTAMEILGRSALMVGDSALALNALKPLAFETYDASLRRSILAAAIAVGDLDFARSLITYQSAVDKEDRNLDQQFAVVERRIRVARQAAADGDKAMKKKEWVVAARDYRKALRAHPVKDTYKAKLHLARAEILVTTEGELQAEAAFRHIDQAIGLWPGGALPFWIKGDICMQLGRYAEAKEAFRESLRLGIEKPFDYEARAVVESKS